MGFTAGMDDVDEVRSSRAAPQSARAPGTEGAAGERGAGRTEEPLGGDVRPTAVRARGDDPASRCRLRDELQLLASLEVAGIGAAPAVLEIEDDGYVRETAPALAHRAGRRSADGGAPSTAERLALRRARDELDALVDALHERGWVLGAPDGGGLGMRQDGGVVVLDLSGLRREDGLAPRRADRRWVDSVLGDQERTLRRRVDLLGPAGQAARYAVTEDELPGRPVPGPPLALHQPDPAPAPAAVAPPPPRAVPLRRRAATPAGAVPPRRHRTLRVSLRRGAEGVTQVLAQPRLRRIASLSALVVLMLGSVLAGGIWWGHEQDPAARGGAEARQAPTVAGGNAGAGKGSEEPPPIEDPWALAAELAGARHAYVTGTSAHPVTVPDSPAAAADDDLRTAYRGIEVRGGGPVIHEARLESPPGSDGTAVLRTEASMAAHRVEDPEGAATEIPATEPVTVMLTLRWASDGWRIEEVEEIGAGSQG